MKLKYSCLLVFTSLFSSSVIADSWGSPNVGGGTRVTGHSRSGSIATPSNVSRAASWTVNAINTQITHVGNAIITEIQKASGVNQTQTEAQTIATAEIGKDSVKAQARIDSEVNHGPESMGSGACTSDKSAQTAADIKNVKEAVKSQGKQVVGGHVTSGVTATQSKQILKQSLDTSKEGALNLVPEGGTATKEQFQAGLEYIKTTVEPTPSPKLPDNVQGASVEKYNNLAEWRAQHLMWPTVILTDVHARTAPTVDVDDAVNLVWANAGFEGSPPHVDGKISQDTYEQILVDSRFRSSKWHGNKDNTGIRSMSEKGILIELAEMQAFMVELLHENNKIQRYLASIEAERRASEVQDSTTIPLQNLYRQAASDNPIIQ